MLPNEVFALACRAYYDEIGLVVDKRNGQFAHCPYPKGMGETGYYLLWEHHQQQGLLQSRDVGRRCFFTGHPKKWLLTCNPLPENYFELWDIYEEFVAGEHSPAHGKTRLDVSERNSLRLGEKRPEHSERMSGELNPMYGKTGILCPSYGRERDGKTKEKISRALTGRFLGEENPMFGKTGDKHPRSKKVEVTYPEGTVKVFSSTKFAGESLDCDPNSVSKWCRETCAPTRGKFAGHTFRYLEDQIS